MAAKWGKTSRTAVESGGSTPRWRHVRQNLMHYTPQLPLMKIKVSVAYQVSASLASFSPKASADPALRF